MNAKRKAVVLLCGGLDTATAAAIAKLDGFNVDQCSALLSTPILDLLAPHDCIHR